MFHLIKRETFRNSAEVTYLHKKTEASSLRFQQAAHANAMCPVSRSIVAPREGNPLENPCHKYPSDTKAKRHWPVVRARNHSRSRHALSTMLSEWAPFGCSVRKHSVLTGITATFRSVSSVLFSTEGAIGVHRSTYGRRSRRSQGQMREEWLFRVPPCEKTKRKKAHAYGAPRAARLTLLSFEDHHMSPLRLQPPSLFLLGPTGRCAARYVLSHFVAFCYFSKGLGALTYTRSF